MIVSEMDTAGNLYVLYHSFTMARMLYVREECVGCIVCIAGVVPYINKGLVFHCIFTLDPRSCALCEAMGTLYVCIPLHVTPLSRLAGRRQVVRRTHDPGVMHSICSVHP